MSAALLIRSAGPFCQRAAKKRRHLPQDPESGLRFDDDDFDHAVIEQRLRRNLRAVTVLSRVGERNEQRRMIDDDPACATGH